MLELKIRPDNKAGELLSDKEYLERKDTLKRELGILKEKLEDTEGRAARWLELSERFFLFVRYAPIWFAEGTLDDKRLILETLGQDLALADQKLFINAKNPLKILEGAGKIPSWLPSLDSNQETRLQRAVSCHWTTRHLCFHQFHHRHFYG